MRKIVKFVISAFLLLGFVAGGYFLWKNHQGQRDDEGQGEVMAETKAGEAEVPVKVVKAVRGDLPLRLNFSGQADCWEKTTVKAETSGKVARILHGVGQWVKKGEVVVELHSREKELALERARAQRLKALADYIATFRFAAFKEPHMSEKDREKLKRAREEYERVLSEYKAGRVGEERLRRAEESLLEIMVETGALKEQVRKATKGLTEAEISLHQAELELSRTRIRAPFSGIIGDIKVSVGQWISSGSDIFRIVNPASLYIKAFVLEGEVGKIKPGMGARVAFLAYPGRYFPARILAISPEIDPETRTATVFLNLLRKKSGLFPGMTCEVQVEYRVLRDVVKVPRKAIVVRSGRPLVFVVKDNLALWRYIDLGAQNDTEAEVRSGVEEGDLVVVEGQLTLAHQSRVKIVR